MIGRSIAHQSITNIFWGQKYEGWTLSGGVMTFNLNREQNGLNIELDTRNLVHKPSPTDTTSK